MSELRAYAVAVAEVRGIRGAGPPQEARLRALARDVLAPAPPPLRVRDMIGPIYRRVPGAPVVRDEDPTPDDLDVLLAGGPVPPARSVATWRLLEALVAGLAWGSTHVRGATPPPGLLRPVGLAVPAVEGLVVGWCAPEQAEAVEGLPGWLTSYDAWAADARRTGRPRPDVVGFWHAV